MSASYSKQVLTGSTNGRQVVVAGTVAPGTTIHTPSAVPGVLDEIWIYAANNGTSATQLTTQWGGTTAADSMLVLMTGTSGRVLVGDGKLLSGSGPVTAYVSSGTIFVDGFVNRIDPGIDPRANDWALRVVRNGGAAPSTLTLQALSVFFQALSATNIIQKMVSIVVHVPDSLIAASTPIIPGPGLDPWTNNNFVSGDLTINGLKGNGSNKSLNTGIVAANSILTSNSAGMTMYVYDTTSGSNSGHALGSAGAANSSQFSIYPYISGTTAIGYCWRFVNTNVSDGVSAVLGTPGYYCSSRTSGSQMDFYYASSTVAHSSVAQATSAQTGSIEPTYSIYAHAINGLGSISSFCDRRISFLAVHQGLTSADSLNFFNAVQALRVALGGGFV